MCNLFVLDPVWVSAIAAIMAALAALFYVIFTWKLILEMRKDRNEVKKNRELEYKPVINAIFNDASSRYPSKLAFILKNVGKGPALDLKFECKDNDGDYWELEEEILPIGSLQITKLCFVLKEELKGPGSEAVLKFEYKDIFKNTLYGEVSVPFSDLLNTNI